MEGSKYNNKLIYLIVFLIHVGMTIYYSFPLITQMDKAIVGAVQNDSGFFLHNCYTFEESLASMNFSHTETVFYPQGASILFNTNSPMISLLNLALNNPYLSLNLCLLLSLVFTGLGSFILARRYLHNFLAALTVSILATYTFHHLAKLYEHFNLLLIFPVPFYILTFLKSFNWQNNRIKAFRRKKIFPLTVWFFIALLCDYNTAFFILFFSAFAVIAYAYLTWFWTKSKKYTLLGTIAGLVLFHFLFKLILSLKVPFGGGFWFAPDLLNFFVPKHYIIDFGWAGKINDYLYSKGQPFESSPFLGYSVLLLFAGSLLILFWKKLKLKMETQVFILISILFFMAVFPIIKFMGKAVFHLPTSLVHISPVLKNLRCPGRFVTMLAFFMPFVSFLLLKEYLKKKLSYLALFVLILFLIENPKREYPIYSVADAPINSYLKTLDTEAVFYIPVGIRDGAKQYGNFDMMDYFDQMQHRKFINNGYLSRVDASIFEYYEQDVLYNRLVALQQNGKAEALSTEQGSASLKKHKINVMVIRTHPHQAAIAQFIEQSFPDFISRRQEIGGQVVFEFN